MLKSRLVLLAAVLAALLSLTSRPRAYTDLELTLGGGNYQFVVNDDAGFKVFVSYFDALDQSGSNLNTDLAYLAGKGANGIRIFPNWWDVHLDANGFPETPYSYDNDTLCDSNGDLRSATLTKLLGVLDDAKDEGLLVDISMAAETVQGLTLSEFTDCLVDLTQALENGGSAYKHVFIDIQNEYNEADTGPNIPYGLSDSQIATIVTAVKNVDSSRLVTASLSSAVESYDADGKADNANVDILAWHEKRIPNWWNSTASWVGDLDDGGLPVYLQEPARLPDSIVSADGYAANVYNAKNAYADAWTMHNAGSFELGTPTLEENLQDEENDFLDCLAEALSSGTCSSPPTPERILNARGVLDVFKRWLSPTDTYKVARKQGGRR